MNLCWMEDKRKPTVAATLWNKQLIEYKTDGLFSIQRYVGLGVLKLERISEVKNLCIIAESAVVCELSVVKKWKFCEGR